MKIISIEVLDGWGGNVVPGEPTTGDIVRITYDNGTVREKTYRPVDEVPPVQQVFVHFEVSDGDGKNPIGVINNGIHSCVLTATVRTSTDPLSDVVSLNANFRQKLRDEDGTVRDIVMMQYRDGVAEVTYKTTLNPVELTISQEDIPSQVGGRQIIKVGNPRILVYREL